MPGTRAFDLSTARSLIEQALASAGYDVIHDPTEPNLVQARRGDLSHVISVAVDAGGRMRFTRERQLDAEEATARRLASGRALRLVRSTNETLTVLLRVTRTDTHHFAAILAELETL